jgi:1,4-alpha-glucan branching enzyme
VQRLVAALNHLYRSEPALHRLDNDPAGHEWLHIGDSDNSILAFERRDDRGHAMLVVCNFTPTSHRGYRIGVNRPGGYDLLLDTDAADFGGSAFNQLAHLDSEAVPFHGRDNSVLVDIPPLSVTFWRG